MNIPISLNELQGNEGWILAEPILNPMGSILYPAEKALDKTTVDLLKKHFNKAYQPIDKQVIKVKFHSDVLTDEQKKLVESIQEQNTDVQNILSQDLQIHTLQALRKTYLTSEKNMTDTLKIVDECIKDIAKCIQENPEISYSLGQYKDQMIAANVFEHSLRVAQFAITLANIYNHNLSASENYINLKSIGIAALLHDYGIYFKNKDNMKKLSLYQLGDSFLKNYPTIPSDLLQQSYDEKYSTVYAYSALKNFLDNSTLTMILLSGESENGKTRLHINNNKTDATSMGAKIIFLCNLYDSLLHHTIKEDESLENVSSMLESAIKNKVINADLGNLFLDNIPLYSIGVRVLLSTGEYATVVERFKGKDAAKPVVKTLINPPLKPNLIDLRTTTTVTIKKVVASNELLADKIKEVTVGQLKTMGITSIPLNSSFSKEKQTDIVLYNEEERKKAM